MLDRAPALGLGEWWLTAGVLFQAAWNGLTGRPPGTGVRDADLFYWDADTSWEAEDAVIRRAADLFADVPVPVEVRNEARVHLWYAGRFGTAAPPAFRSCTDAVDVFAAVCCSVALTTEDGRPRLYAPYGLDDALGMVVRPNPDSPAPREVYETKAARWQAVWPELTVLPWDR
ncbi:nucleotidyltransferase family protein [Geodermatophilus telluris]|uniref:nucleotidyltransferase family protein n=1 Tax=Geodermatophilus telluris TaxID=1190417 RepID=UPI000B1F8E58|nr:nucleotidyltransferase family protein [Geodermatophilus telluris]